LWKHAFPGKGFKFVMLLVNCIPSVVKYCSWVSHL